VYEVKKGVSSFIQSSRDAGLGGRGERQWLLEYEGYLVLSYSYTVLYYSLLYILYICILYTIYMYIIYYIYYYTAL